MPGLSEDDIRRVREASDLVSVAGQRVVLRQRGRDFWGCCPFHNEKSPSFKIDPLRSCGIVSVAARAETCSASS